MAYAVLPSVRVLSAVEVRSNAFDSEYRRGELICPAHLTHRHLDRLRGGTTVVGVTNMLERLRDASAAHDPHRLASLFAEDYQSSQPLHPGRDFVGRAQVLQNWLSVFEGVPDFSSELVTSAVNGETEWGESYWRGPPHRRLSVRDARGHDLCRA